ncbi:hypothetical protein ACMWHI_05465 [Klebsiella pneumoniae]
MLYVVECAYTDPQSEAAWNTFYNQEKLPALVSVPGFYASQRFRALSEGCPCYLALHEVAPDEVLLLGDTAEDLPVAAPILLQPGGLATEQSRYAAILPRDNLHHLATTAAVFIYQPITARLRNPAQRA